MTHFNSFGHYSNIVSGRNGILVGSSTNSTAGDLSVNDIVGGPYQSITWGSSSSCKSKSTALGYGAHAFKSHQAVFGNAGDLAKDAPEKATIFGGASFYLADTTTNTLFNLLEHIKKQDERIQKMEKLLDAMLTTAPGGEEYNVAKTRFETGDYPKDGSIESEYMGIS